MLLDRHLAQSGSVLFRWRSFVPLLFLPFLILALRQLEPVERFAGDAVGDAFEYLCLSIILAGLSLRAFTVGFVPGRTSGRNTGGQVADVLNTTGIYSLTRNPLYLRNCLAYVGVVLFTQDLLTAFLFTLMLALYYERIIMAEETFLLARFGEDYAAWTARVPALVPRLSGWRPPALPFSARTVLRREYPGWFAAVPALLVIEALGDLLEGETGALLDPGWAIAGLVALTVYVTLRTLKKRSTFLHVEGR